MLINSPLYRTKSFTGTMTDSLGRERHYVNGEQVKGPEVDSDPVATSRMLADNMKGEHIGRKGAANAMHAILTASVEPAKVSNNPEKNAIRLARSAETLGQIAALKSRLDMWDAHAEYVSATHELGPITLKRAKDALKQKMEQASKAAESYVAAILKQTPKAESPVKLNLSKVDEAYRPLAEQLQGVIDKDPGKRSRTAMRLVAWLKEQSAVKVGESPDFWAWKKSLSRSPLYRTKYFDEAKHPRDGGKFSSAPGQAAAPKPEISSPLSAPKPASVESLAAKAKQLPKAVYEKAKAKVKAVMATWEKRYGPKTTKMIVQVGLAAFPVPGGLIAPTVLVAAAEVARLFGWHKSLDLSKEELTKLGKQFMADLMRGEAKAIRSPLVTKSAADWTREKVGESNNRWKNNKTSEVVYSPTNPGGSEAAASPKEESKQREKIQSYADALRRKFGDKAPQALAEMKEKVAGDAKKVRDIEKVEAVLTPKRATQAVNDARSALEAARADLDVHNDMTEDIKERVAQLQGEAAAKRSDELQDALAKIKAEAEARLAAIKAKYNAKRAKYAKIESPLGKSLTKSAQDWSRQTGEQGGTYWLNAKSGEKKYQAENPGGAERGPGEEAGKKKPAQHDEAKLQSYATQLRDKFGDQAVAKIDEMVGKIQKGDPTREAKIAALGKVKEKLGVEKPKTAQPQASRPATNRDMLGKEAIYNGKKVEIVSFDTKEDANGDRVPNKITVRGEDGNEERVTVADLKIPIKVATPAAPKPVSQGAMDRAKVRDKEVEAAQAKDSKAAKVTQTPEFKKWFGESKIVNSDGTPKRMFHGTNSQFSEFDQGKAGGTTKHAQAALGFFFHPHAGESSHYGGNVMPVYISMNKPYEMNVDDFYKITKDTDPAKVQAFRDKLEKAGHDGIVIRAQKGTLRHELEGDVAIAFKPEQIKSAIANRTFDPKSRDVSKLLRSPLYVKSAKQGERKTLRSPLNRV